MGKRASVRHAGAELTLGARVRPVIGHSLTPRGASMEAAFACSTHGSLMMFTVKPPVALMLRLVSFSCCELVMQLNEMSGGFGAT